MSYKGGYKYDITGLMFKFSASGGLSDALEANKRLLINCLQQFVPFYRPGFENGTL
jgi:hypothetical protein